MRSVCPSFATLVALTMFIPSMMFGQGSSPLSIVNYRFVSEQRSTRTDWFVTYRADVANTGLPRSGVTATVTSLTPNIQVVAGQGTLHFGPIPANSQVTSLDTFTILVDRTVPFDFASLRWAFLNPLANPGPNQTVAVGATVNLNGGGSTNPAGGPLTYAWSFASRPGGSSAVLVNPTSVTPSFVVDVAGNYVVTLTVDNGTATDSANVTISTANSTPVARAGANQTVAVGNIVALNGSGSSDVDGDPLTYFWTMVSQPAGSTAFIANFRSVSASFTADRPGSYMVRLVVNDGKVDSAPSTMTVTTGNTKPVANAGTSRSVAIGSLVQLNGSGSTDVDGDPLTYKWSLLSIPAGSTAVLSSTSIVNPTFTANLPGTYVAQLIVNDGTIDSDPSTVTLTTNSAQAPTANAGANQTVVHGSTVTLAGSGTDPQNLPLTYTWSLITRPAGSTALLPNPTNPTITFGVDKPGTYVAQLIVSNGTLSSAPSTVTITTTNTLPVANAGPNQATAIGTTVALDGGASFDADSDPLSYSWTFSSKPAGSSSALLAATSRTPTFFADVAGSYVVQLIVNDGFGNSDPKTVTITAATKNIILTPNPLNLSNAPGTLLVGLTTPAEAGGVIVTLSGFDPNIISMPTRVTIPENSTGVNVTVTPVNAGSTNILATGGTYQPGAAVVNVVTPSIGVTLSATGVGITRTITGTLTLSVPAPAGGVSVALTASPAGGVFFTPTSITIGAGSTTGNFNLTGVTEGMVTVTASSAGYNSGTASVLVVRAGIISLAQNVNLVPGQVADLNVSLSTPAPAGGVTITLISSDTSKVQVTASVTIAQGATTPVTQPQVTGINFGSSTITASGTGGYTSDSQAVKVGATLSLSPATLTLVGGTPQNLTLTLSAPAPVGGLVVNLASSAAGVVTIPATATIAAGATTATFAVTGASAGTTTITASTVAPNVPNATASVTVQGNGALLLPSGVTVGLGQSTAFQVTLPAAAPAGGVTVTLVSSDASKLSISPATVTIAAGATTPTTAPQVTGKIPGSANITASAPLYTSATQAVQVTATITFSPLTLSVSSTETKNLTLTLSGPAPTGGFAVNVSSSNPAAATIPAAVFTIPATATTVTIPVTGVAAGSSVIRATAAGLTDATANVTVTLAIDIIMPATVTLGPGDSVPFAISLARPAPGPAGLFVTLTSSDPSKATVSLGGVTIAAGETLPTRQPNLNGLVQGTTTITASATGLNSATSLVTVGQSATLSPANLSILGTTGDGNLTLTLSSPAQSNLIFTLTSSNPGVASVPLSLPVSVGTQVVSFKVTGVSTGTTVIRASASGYPDTTSNVTVLPPGTMTMSVNTTSIFLSQAAAILTVTLSPAAPAGGVTVNLGFDPRKLGMPASIFIPQGSSTGTASIVGGNVGNHPFTASALGYTAPAPIVMQVGAVIAWLTPNVSAIASGQQVQYELLLFATVPGSTAFSVLDGIQVNISSSNTAVATVQSPVNFFWDGSTIPATRVTVNILSAGTTQIHASGINIADVVMNLTVTGPLNITTASLAGGSVGTSYNAPVAATGGTTPYAWSATGLPAGLNINPTTGQITGTPTAVGSNSVNLTVTDANSATFRKTLTLDISGAAAASIAVSSGSPQTTNVSTAFGNPLVVLVKDAGNNPLPNVTVTFAAPASGAGAVLSGATATTNASGLASITATANGTSGSYSVSASVTGVATAATFALTNNAVSGVTVSSGSPQTTVISTAFTSPLVALVKDSSNNPLPNVTVTFTVPGGGASAVLSSPTATTNAAGLASVTATANATAGSYTVAATIAGGGAPANFSLTNTAAGPLTVTTTTVPNGAVGTAYSTTVLATGGTAPYTWSANGLPSPLVINSTTGQITGTPTAVGSSNVTVTVNDTAGGSARGSFTLVITVQPLVISTTSLVNGTAGTAYTAPVAATGGVAPYSWSATGLPSPLVINATTGQITGTPTAPFTGNVVVSVTDSAASPTTVTKTLSLTIASQALAISTTSLPNGTATVAYSAPVAATGGTTPYSWSATGLPAPLVINATTGQITGTPTAAFSGNVVVTVTDAAASPATVSKTLSLTIAPPPLTITTTSLVNGTSGVAYTAPVAATGGVTPYAWSATGLPAPLVINATTGQITGTPTAPFTGNVVVSVTDSAASPVTVTKTLSLTIMPPALVISTPSLPDGVVGTAYTAPMAATGGVTPYAWSATGLPAPLGINATTGQITGTPTATFNGPVVITVTDSASSPVSTSKTLNLTIVPPGLAITTTSLVSGTVGVAYTAPVVATGGVTPYTWSATGLPAPLVINATTGQITGTPTAPFSGNIVVSVTDSASSPTTATKTLSLTIAPPPLEITTTSLVNGTSGVAYTAPVAATGGVTPYAWSATGLPAPLVINATTGQITGTPTATFSGNIVISVTDSATSPTTVTKTLSLTIAPPALTITTTSLVNGTAGTAYTAPVAATGGVAPYAWSATGLPAPLVINATTGQITGTPTAAFTGNVVFSVTDSALTPTTVTKTLSLTIAPQIVPATITIQSGNNQSTRVTTAYTAPFVVLVKDSSNNPMANVPVTFAVPAAGASGSFGGTNTVNTDALGIATSAVLTANTVAGAFNVTITAGSITATMGATNLPGNPANIAVSGGSPQSAIILTPFASTLKAVVTDANSNVVPGVTVTFTAPAGSVPSASFAGGVNTAVTDASGVATSTVVTANGRAGGFYNVVASAGSGLNANFQLTNLVGGPAAIGVVSGSGQTTAINTTFTAPLRALLTDIGGNPLRGYTMLFTAPASGASGTFVTNTAVTDNSGVATSTAFTANGTTGSYSVIASVSGVASTASFTMTNGACVVNCGGDIIAANLTIGNNLQTSLLLTLSPAAPTGGVALTITSNSPGLALVGGGSVAGQSTITAAISEGTTTVSTNVQALSASGTSTITISAPGYQTKVVTITFASSGFFITGPLGLGTPFTAFQGTTTGLTINSGRLNASGALGAIQQVRGGLTVSVPLSSNVASVGTVSAASVSFSGGADTATANFLASAINTGTTDIIASAPSGFTTPVTGGLVNATVSTSTITPTNTTIGQGLQKAITVSLTGNAPNNLPVTITSNDPSKLLFSLTPTGVGSTSIVVTIPIGRSVTPDFYAQALSSTGAPTYLVQASGFTSATGTITMAASGFRITSPGGIGALTFSSPIGFGDANITVETGRLSGSSFVEAQLVSGGTTISVTVVSSNTSVGTITSSPISIAGGVNSALTRLRPLVAGSTNVTATAPNFTSASVGATFTNSQLLLTGGLTIGKKLQDADNVTLPQPAGPGGTQITLTSTSANLLLSATQTGAGSNSITLTLPQGQQSASFYVQALTDNGTHGYTASSAGYPLKTVDFPAQFMPSAILILTTGFGSSTSGSVGSTLTNVNLVSARLLSDNSPDVPQAVAGGVAVSASLTSSDISKATVPATASIQPGQATGNVPVSLFSAGSAVISIPSQPAGFATPTNRTNLSVLIF